MSSTVEETNNHDGSLNETSIMLDDVYNEE